MKKKEKIEFIISYTPKKKSLRVWVTKNKKKVELDNSQFEVQGNSLTIKDENILTIK